MGFGLFKAAHYKGIGRRNLGKYSCICIFSNHNYSVAIHTYQVVGAEFELYNKYEICQLVYFLRYSLGEIEAYLRKTREKCPGEEKPR